MIKFKRIGYANYTKQFSSIIARVVVAGRNTKTTPKATPKSDCVVSTAPGLYPGNRGKN